MNKNLAQLGLFAASLLGSAPALAQSPVLQPAFALYQQGRIDEAQASARKLLGQLTRPADRRDAHLLLGACAFVRGDTWRAESEIISALSHDPTYRPDPLLLSPDLQAMVRRVARQRADEIARLAAARQRSAASQASASAPATGPARPAASRPAIEPEVKPEPARTAEPTSIWVAMLPFGIGQFANGQHTKAWLLLVSQLSLATTSVACLGAALSLRDEHDTYSFTKIDRARALNVAYLAAAYSAAALIVYGAIDGLLNRQRHHRAGASAAERRAWWIGPSPAADTLGLDLGVSF